MKPVGVLRRRETRWRPARWIGAAACVVVLALVATGCGGGGGGEAGSDEEQAYVDAFSARLLADAPPELGIDEAGTDCVAESVIGIVGVEQFADAGVSPEDVQTLEDLPETTEPNEEQAGEIADATFECIDFGAIFAELIAGEASSGGVEIAQEKWDCVGDKFAESDEFRSVMVQSILGSDAASDPPPDLIVEVISACLTTEELLQIGMATQGG